MTDLETEQLEFPLPPSRATKVSPCFDWRLVTNQLNLMYMLANGLITGPQGLGRKHFADASSQTPGWIPLFSKRIPQTALDEARSEGDHLRPLVALVNLKTLAGPVRALDDHGRMRELHFPDGLDGTEQLLLVPAPLPASWIKAILYPGKDEWTAAADEAADYANVPLDAYTQRVNAGLFKGSASDAWPPAPGMCPDRDAPCQQASAVGALLALLFALGNTGDEIVDASRLMLTALDGDSEIDQDSVREPMVHALAQWVATAPETNADPVQTRMLLRILNAIVEAKTRVDNPRDEDDTSPDIQEAVLEALMSQQSSFPEPERQEALNRLVDDLKGIAGLGGHTVSELLTRHPKSFSRGLILFFLRKECEELLDFTQPLLTDRDRMVAAALFAARSGWIGIPAELRRTNKLGEAIMHRMASLEHRTRSSGLEIGPPPPLPLSLRALLTPSTNPWSKSQQAGALALSRAMGWKQLLQTRISLGKGDYRLQLDSRGAHLMLEGDVHAVTVEVDQPGLLALLAEATIPPRVDRQVRNTIGV